MNDRPGKELQKDWRAIASTLVAEQGWRYSTGKGHSTLYPADRTQRPITLPHTPSDKRAYPNFIAAVRRACGAVR